MYVIIMCTHITDQEMELVVNQSGMFRSFSNEWRVKWAPAVMLFCKSLKRKEIVQTISTYNSSNAGVLKPKNYQ